MGLRRVNAVSSGFTRTVALEAGIASGVLNRERLARNTAMNCLGADIGDCIPLANRCADRQVDGAGRCCSLRCVRPIFEPRQISNRPLMFGAL